jgi:hypothetical protein
VKKKQRCFVKRFAALVAALMLCASLCVPAFASNNAQWRKWVITAEKNLTNESGTVSKYFQLTPFQDGEIYAATFTSHMSELSFYSPDASGAVFYRSSQVLYCDNYPDWWRSSIPLGNRSYVQVDVKSLESSSSYSGPRSALTSGYLYVGDLNYSLLPTAFSYGDALQSASGSVSMSSAPTAFLFTGVYNAGQTSGNITSDALFVKVGSSYTFCPNDLFGLALGWPFLTAGAAPGVQVTPVYYSNLSSDRIVIAFIDSRFSPSFKTYFHASAEVTYWVDANKLPSGLQVGDEFPADTDAFDRLRDELLNQFPEASENIQNGKDTLTGWNDTETVDTDVASSAMSALNAMFQNLGSFLFIISLMVFGAVVLRMFIKKAVDG